MKKANPETHLNYFIAVLINMTFSTYCFYLKYFLCAVKHDLEGQWLNLFKILCSAGRLRATVVLVGFRAILDFLPVSLLLNIFSARFPNLVETTRIPFDTAQYIFSSATNRNMITF